MIRLPDVRTCHAPVRDDTSVPQDQQRTVIGSGSADTFEYTKKTGHEAA
jgi:hypothetical protein